MSKNKVLPILLSLIDSSTFTGAYQAINPTGLPNACFEILIINDSNRDIGISFDGTTDHLFLPENQRLEFNFQTNAQPQNNTAQLALGTVVYVKGNAAGTGFVALSGWYQPNN